MAQACPHSSFCLGMCEFSCPGRPGPANSTLPVVSAHNGATTSVNASAIASSSRAPPNNQCFSEFIDDKELAEMGMGLIPANNEMHKVGTENV